MTMTNASRKDIQSFHQWLKTQPWQETSFLYQTYMRDDQREEKLKELFSKFAALTPEQRFPKQNSKGLSQVKPLPSHSGGTTPLTPTAPTLHPKAS